MLATLSGRIYDRAPQDANPLGGSTRIPDRMPVLYFIAGIAGAAIYALVMRDLIRRGRLHRRAEELKHLGAGQPLTAGRVPCPECAEAVLPIARRCPYCRSVIPRATT